jgi:hypothetical protein
VKAVLMLGRFAVTSLESDLMAIVTLQNVLNPPKHGAFL